MPRILEGCKARTRSLGNAVMKIAYATLICPLQAGALIQSLITCSQTSIASQTLTAAEYQMSCYSVISFQVHRSHQLVAACNIYSVQSSPCTEHRVINFLMCFFQVFQLFHLTTRSTKAHGYFAV